jgi:very-short-patch-repair endonuclease
MAQIRNINYFKRLSQGADRKVFELARERRQNQTLAEKILWDRLKNKKLGGFKFRRQHPMIKYIADFYCPAKKLVIELDGKYHSEIEQAEKDRDRTEVISSGGVRVVRIVIKKYMTI